TVRSVADFVDAASLANVAFLIEGIPPDEWISWGLFLRAENSERTRRPRAIAPSICFVVPDGVVPDDVRAALGGSGMRWMGVTSRLDSQIYADQATGFGGDDLVSRTAVSTITEIGAWDPSLIRALAKLPVEVQLDPRQALMSAGVASEIVHPCWANGLVD